MGLRERAQRLAGALQLDEAERAHLLDLAHAAHPTSLGRFTALTADTQANPRRSVTGSTAEQVIASCDGQQRSRG
jgi:hypothetical protein